MNGEIIHRNLDGTETKLTMAVLNLWEFVINSLDWGSGWFNAEDSASVAKIALLLGLPQHDRIAEYAKVVAEYQETRTNVIDANLPEI